MSQLTSFKFVLDWYLNCQFAGLIWAHERGLYQAAGLDVTLIHPNEYPTTSTLNEVMRHELAAGCMEDNLVVRAALAGKGVRAIGAMLQQTPMVLMTAPDNGIQTLHDLPGRHIGMHADGEHLLRTVLTLHGIDHQQVKISVGGWDLHALINGQLDAVQGYTITEPADLKALGLTPYLIPVRHHQLHPYAQMMFTTTTCIKEHKNVLQSFMNATFEGWRQAMTHKQEAAALVAAVSRDQPDPVVNEQILEAMYPIVVGGYDLERLGILNRGRWERNLATYHQFGMVDRLASFEEVVDNQFTPDHNPQQQIGVN
ncbi:MAG: ABC transporter substrate-binding protein [Chloroflexota bacterium]